MKKKQKYLFNYINHRIFHIKAFIFLQIVKIILNKCDRNNPIKLEDGSCILKYCSPEDYNLKKCVIDNPIVKTQYLNDIIIFGENNFMYTDFITFSTKEMIAVTSSFPGSEKRIFYGLNENGKYYFKKENGKETPFYSLPTTDIKVESANAIFIRNGKEYFLSIGRLESETEIYDFENKIIYHEKTSNLFSNYIHSNVKSNLLTINKDINRYLLNIMISKDNTNEVSTTILYRFDLNLNDDNSLSITNSKEISKDSFGIISSCFMIESIETIICFIYEDNNYYNIIAYNTELIELKNYNFNSRYIKNSYLYSIYFREDAGAFIYYKYLSEETENVYPNIFFKRFNYGKNDFEDYFSENNSILLDKYIFESFYAVNEFIKISDSKIGLFCSSLEADILYIIILNIFDINNSNHIKVRYYSIEFFNLYYLLILNDLKAHIYKNFIILGVNSCYSGSLDDNDRLYYTVLMIFGYPNGTDFEINIIDDLLINNNSTIDNLTIDMSEYLQIDNNIFGYVYDGIEINDVTNLDYIFLVSSISNKIFDSEENNVVSKEEKIKINFTNNYYFKSEYNFIYSYIVSEPEYEEYDNYTINVTISYGNDNKEIFDNNKNKYKGKLINCRIYLYETLTKECETNCNLCFTNKTCITYKPIMEISTISESIEFTKSKTTEIFESSKITDITETTQITTIPKISEITTVAETTKNTLKSEVTEIYSNIPKITQVVSEYNNEKTESKNDYITEETLNEEISQKTQEIEILNENITCTNEAIINNNCQNIIIGNQQIKEIHKHLVNEITKNKTNVIIKTKNVKFQITPIEDLKQTENNEISTIDLGECENILKQVTSNPLKVLKIDYKSDDLSSTYVQYEIYDILTGAIIDLIKCKDIPIKISVPKILDEETLTIYNNLSSLGYNLFDSNDSFYNDICSSYTSDNKKDMLLIDRWEDIYIPNNEKYMCQSGCKLINYNITNQRVDCECYFQKQDIIETLEEINFDKTIIIETFMGSLKYSNFRVLKCGHLLMRNISKNYGFIIIAAIVIIIFILMIIYFITGPKHIKRIIDSIIYKKFKSQNKTKDNGKNNNKNKSNNIKNKKGKNNSKKIYETEFAINKSKFKNNKSKSKNHKNNKRIITNNADSKNIKNKLDKENKNEIKKHHFPPKKNSKFKDKEIYLSPNRKDKLTDSSHIKNNSKNYLLNKKNKIIIYKKNLNGSSETTTKSKFPASENHNLFNLNPKKKEYKLKTYDKKINKNKHLIILNDEELNNLEYLLAIEYDKRTYFQYYCSLLKKKQLILFSFFPNTDFNLLPLKISLFFMSFAIYFTIHGFFF